jgi:2-iminobutanoate/2-iminopropanoate deaminase
MWNFDPDAVGRPVRTGIHIRTRVVFMAKQGVWTTAKVEQAPYTPGIKAGGLLFVSGQLALDPNTKKIVEGEFEDRVRQCLRNVEAVVAAAGGTLDDVVKVTVFLTDMGLFSRMNAVYGACWGEVKPARTCIEVSSLPLDADVEIEAIACIG